MAFEKEHFFEREARLYASKKFFGTIKIFDYYRNEEFLAFEKEHFFERGARLYASKKFFGTIKIFDYYRNEEFLAFKKGYFLKDEQDRTLQKNS